MHIFGHFKVENQLCCKIENTFQSHKNYVIFKFL